MVYIKCSKLTKEILKHVDLTYKIVFDRIKKYAVMISKSYFIEYENIDEILKKEFYFSEAKISEIKNNIKF